MLAEDICMIFLLVDAPEDQLTVSEAAMLASLVRAPSRLDPTTEAVEEETGGETRFWVVGGTYTDTHFETPANGEEAWFGPFDSYDDAKAEWQRHAWASVDDALSRYRIEKRSGARPAQAG